MNKSFVIFIFIISACNNRTEIKLTDLKFPFPDKVGVLTNDIDSTILISVYNSQIDTIGLVTYDSGGRILYDRGPWNTYRYQYDSFGIVQTRWWRDWDVYLQFESSNDYFPDSLLLVQHWTGDYNYTTRFKFNANGYLLEESDDLDNLMDVWRPTRTTTFEYNHDQDLVKKKVTILHDNKMVEQSTMSVFYNNKKVDSVVTILNSNKWGASKIVDHYNTNGLRRLTLKQEPGEELQRIEYIHKSRNER